MTLHTADKPKAAHVSLRRLVGDDAERIRRWMLDPDLVRFTVLVPGPEYAIDGVANPEAAEHYIDQLLRDPRRLSYAILLDGVHVGNVGLKDFEAGQPEAECFIEIGDRRWRGRGIGRAAMELLLEQCFLRLGLRAVRLGVFDFNHSAIGLYRRLGFRHVGRYGWHWSNGSYHEVLGMRLERRFYLGQDEGD